MAFRWLADAGPLMVVIGLPLPSSTKKEDVVKVGTPLAKPPGSAHVILRKNGESDLKTKTNKYISFHFMFYTIIFMVF